MILAVLFIVTAQLPADGAGDSGVWMDLRSDWRFRPVPKDGGAPENWQDPMYPDADWASLHAGERWEDQGFPEVDGYAWYRRSVEVPQHWQGKNVWLALGGVNDMCEIFCNGRHINIYGDRQEISVAETPLIAELSDHLQFGQTNLIAIRCFDWGGSGGLWHPPCAITTDPARLPLESLILCFPDCDRRVISVDADLTGLGNERPETTLLAKLFVPGNDRAVAEESAVFARGACAASVLLPLPENAQTGVYRIEALPLGADQKPLAGVSVSTEISCASESSWPEPYASLRVLNNFVTELLIATVPENEKQRLSFSNPRDGWVFIAAEAGGGDAPHAVLNDSETALVWRVNPETDAFEAMQRLPEGSHRITITASHPARLIVRTMPEIAFCYYPSGRHISVFPEYNWTYMDRHALPHVNTLIASTIVPPAEFDQWRLEGRQWISNSSLPGLNSKEAPSSDEVFQIWAANPGVTNPGFAGMIVDEFLESSVAHYQAWGDAVQRLDALPGFQGKKFYAWCGDIFRLAPSLEFSRMLMKHGHRFAWEIYQCEEPTADEAKRVFLREVAHTFKEWRTKLPGIERHMVLCLGYLSAPPESLNRDPAVDYHVFLDLQFQILANDPAFQGIYGIMEYMAAYADEESLRWAHRLFRHYCIEGRCSPLSADPFALPHLRNPDFDEGLSGWQVEPAEPGRIGIQSMKGFSWLEGRYPRTSKGDQFCCMKSSAKGPNRVRQEIRGLTPGRLYSVKLLSADIRRLDQSQILPLNVSVEGAEALPEFGFQFPYPSCYSHEVKPYTRDHPAWFNLHRLVFRATADVAELVIADIQKAEGHVIGFNFVEVQPFHAP